MKLAFLFFLFPWLSWATSSLANSQEWLNLLHMRNNFWGQFESSIRGEGFFLSPDGYRDPQAELSETVRKMFGEDSDIARKTQCQFLARRDFLLRHGPVEWKQKVEACEFSDEWLKKLNTQKISLIFAASYMNSAASSFGHTFLKLQNPENAKGKALLDYGVNFAARTQETKGALYALYGLTGYFPGAFAMVPYHQLIKEYTHLEGRDLWEYELNLTPAEVQRGLFHLLELDQVYFDYYFLDDNCSFALLKLLEVARPGLHLADDEEGFVIPLDTVKAVRPLISKVHFRPALETEWSQRRDRLNSLQLSQLVELQQKFDLSKVSELETDTVSAANFLFSLKEIENREKWKEANFQLARERARRPQTASEEFQIQQPEQSPDQGPDSSSIELGFLQQDRKSFALGGIRFAFHDQLSRNVGVSPFSHLEVLSFQWQSMDLKQTWLRRYRVIEMLSTQGIDSFAKPLSWGLSLGGESTGLSPTRVRHHVNGGAGYSFDFLKDQIRWTTLLKAAYRQSLEQQFRLNPGIDSRIWFLWTPEIRTLAQFEFWKEGTLNTQEISLSQAWDLTSQLEFRAGWKSFEHDSKHSIEQSVSFVQNFLF